MLRVESRESAHVKSRVKDLSVVPNVASYTALLACITPIAKLEKNKATDLYDPILIRDVDSLIANFGDPRIDPNKYIDLYSIMQLVGNGGTCYVAKVPSGDAGVYNWKTIQNHASIALEHDEDESETFTIYKTGQLDHECNVFTVTIAHSDASVPATVLGEDAFTVTHEEVDTGKYVYTITLNSEAAETDTLSITSWENPALGMTAYSSMAEPISITVTLTQAKPQSLKAYYLLVSVANTVDGRLNTLSTAKVKLEKSTTNLGLVNAINSAIGTYVQFELNDPSTAGACENLLSGANSIVYAILNDFAPYNGESRRNLENNVDISTYISVKTQPNFRVTLEDYKKTLMQYKAKKYVGCIMSDLTAPMNFTYTADHTEHTVFGVPSYEDRRSLHYWIKEVACERKDCTCIFSAPYKEDPSPANSTPYTLDQICGWVSSTGGFEALWEYGQTNTTNYAEQSFYLEMYASWLKWNCTKIVNGNAGAEVVMTAPSNLVINNILTSYRERGVQYPVAGDQYGVLPESCTVFMNPATKAERDQLVQYRINPIYDTGTRGIQIYGNETLNAGYTDLNAAHIARALVYIRSTIDEYTERLKFSINSLILWDTWKGYVTNYILEPLKSENCLAEYSVAMGTDTTTNAEIANRKINGEIRLRFYQSAETFDLTYTVYSSATTLDEAMANT